MSTDYGLKCADCNQVIIQENLSKWAVEPLVEAAEHIERFMAAFDRVSELSMEISAYWCSYDLPALLRWIAQHSHHKLIVVDEYGKEY